MTWVEATPSLLTRRLHLSKGQRIAIEGRLQTRQWDDDAGVRHLVWTWHSVRRRAADAAQMRVYNGEGREREASPSPPERDWRI